MPCFIIFNRCHECSSISYCFKNSPSITMPFMGSPCPSVVSTTFHHHVCKEECLYRSCLRMKGRPATPTPFLTPIMLAMSNKCHVITMRVCYTDYVVCKWGVAPPQPLRLTTARHLEPRHHVRMMFIVVLLFF